MAKLKIANTIRRLRFEAGEMTQKDLAERTGVTRQTIVAIENARYFPTLELAFQIARVFGKPLEDVFMVEEPGPRAPPSWPLDGMFGTGAADGRRDRESKT